MTENEVPRLRRRTDYHRKMGIRSVPWNQFWSQAQTILIADLLAKGYHPDLYVPAMAPSGKEVALDVLDFLDGDGGPPCLLLVGAPGVGKTTALLRLEALLNSDSNNKRVWIYFSGNTFSTEIGASRQFLLDALEATVATALKSIIGLADEARNSFFRDIYDNDPELVKETLFQPKPDARQAREAVEAVLRKSPSHYLSVVLRYFVRSYGSNGVVLIVDNLDVLETEIQKEAVAVTSQLAAACALRAIVAIRKKTESELRYSDKVVIANFVRTPVSPPSMADIIRKRIEKALQNPAALNSKLGENYLQFKVRECPEFSDLLAKAFSSRSVQELLDNITNQSVRECLGLAVKVYSSHVLDARRIIRKLSPAEAVIPSIWSGHLPYHVVLKAVMFCDYPVYLPEHGKVGNIFGTTYCSTCAGPFVRLYILAALERLPAEISIEIEELVAELVAVLSVSEQVIRPEIDWLLRDDWIERTSPFQVLITIKGKYIFLVLSCDVEYLTHISTDVPMYAEFEQRLMSPAEKIGDRLQNLVALLEYLSLRERDSLKEISRRGLNEYVRLFGDLSIVDGMLDKVMQRVDSIAFDDPHREESMNLVRQQLVDLHDSEIMEKIRGYFKIYRRGV